MMSAKPREGLSTWLLLKRLPLSGGVLLRLARAFQPIDGVHRATRQRLARLGVGEEALAMLAEHRVRGEQSALGQALQKDQAWLAKSGAQLMGWDAPDYPALLRAIANPPPLLFLLGQREALQYPQLAVVGSRVPSSAGRRNAAHFAEQLARAGLGITSGLARGIDGVGHEAALAAGGFSVAVLACGLDRVYPPEHHSLAKRIAQDGVLVSEHPPGSKPLPHHFPHRNRVISGLSLGVLVVEAGLRSGSLITARHALQQNREVFAVPGSIYNPLARGPHEMIRQGAKLVEEVGQVLEELDSLCTLALEERRASEKLREAPGSPGLKAARAAPEAALPAAEAALLEHMGYDPVSADQLAERSRLAAGELARLLTTLELKGLVSVRNGFYSRMGKPGSRD